MEDKKSESEHPYNDDVYKRSYEEIRKFETLISSLSADLGTVDSENLDKIVHNWMTKIARTLDAEVSVLFRRDTHKNLYISDYWRKNDGTKPILYDPATVFPYLTSVVLKGSIVSISSIEDLPDEAETDKENLKKFGTTSFLFFPLGIGKHVLGAFLFANKTKTVSWDSSFVDKLGFIVHIFSAVIRREYDLEKLKERMRYESLLSELSRDFVTMDTKNIDEKITYWLPTSAATLGADRALIFNLDNHGKLFLYASWRSERGKDITPYNPEELFPWMTTQLRNNKPVIISDASSFPEEAEKDRESMSIIGAASVLVLPLLAKTGLSAS